MAFGTKTITFVNYVEAGTPGALGTYAVSEVKVDAPNCRHRPLTFKETAELDTDVATELWKTVRPHDDMDGAPFKMTILSQRQIG